MKALKQVILMAFMMLIAWLSARAVHAQFGQPKDGTIHLATNPWPSRYIAFRCPKDVNYSDLTAAIHCADHVEIRGLWTDVELCLGDTCKKFQDWK